MRAWRVVRYPLTLEGWERQPSRWMLVLGEIVWWVGAILAGMGLAWILRVLHQGGITP